MRKTILLSMIALLASTGMAAAATVTLITLDGWCNAYRFSKAHGLYALKDLSCTNAFGDGIAAKVRGEGSNLIIALTDPGTVGYQFEYVFSQPFVTGGTWTLYYTNDGLHVVRHLSGTYTVVTGAGQHPELGTKSATSR